MAVSLRSVGWAARAGRVALALGLLIGFAVLAGPRLTGSGERAVPRPHVLALRAQSLISARIGATDPEFAARRAARGYTLTGGGVSAALGPTGARIVADGSVSVSMSVALAAVGRGARLDPAGAARISARGNRVAYGYRGADAWYAAGPLGIEQGFTIARRPVGTRAPLTLALDVGGSLSARLTRSGIRFLTRSRRLALSYGGLAAVDATGRPLPATLALALGHGHANGRVFLTVRDAGARYPVRIDPLFQLAPKLTGPGEIGQANFGNAVSLSGDGNTALIAGPNDHGGLGAAWVFVRSGSTWTEQAKLTAGGESGAGNFGFSTSISSDGNTALIGGDANAANAGAAWVFTRSGSTWTQQAKLTGPGEIGAADFGFTVALSGTGSTALVGGPFDNSDAGAAWVFTRAGTAWSAGTKLAPNGEVGAGWFGTSVALSGAGTTALIGGIQDSAGVGAAWVYTGSGSTWAQHTKLTGSGEAGAGYFGDWVALSADASTALIGGFVDNGGAGAAWVFTHSGADWSQLGSKLVPGDESGAGRFGVRLALSGNGTAAIIGGYLDNNGVGAAWLFTRSGSTWTQQGAKLTANDEVGDGQFGFSASLSSDGNTALIGAQNDNGYAGGAWIFGNSSPACSNTAATTAVGGGTVTLALPCSGPAGLPLSYAIAAGPAHGVLGPIDQTTGTVSYTPVQGYTGTDQFTYQASGPTGVSNTATATITIPRPTVRLNPIIGYTFHPGRKSTLFTALFLNGVPSAAWVHISCHGRRCPFEARVARVTGHKACKGRGKHRRCTRKPPPRVGNVNLMSFFRHRRLTVGTTLTISVVEPGTIGKVYILTMRRSRPPAIRVTCLAPGSTKPGVGC